MTDTWGDGGSVELDDVGLTANVEPFDDEAFSDGDDDGVTSFAMFEGDTSSLFPEQRRCLHALLKLRYISAERYPDHWATLLASEDLIRSRLNDLFLRLHVDRNYQVAFKRQATTETDGALPSLLRDMAHTKEETIVMMYLRQRFFSQRQEGDNVVFVDRQTLLDEVADLRPEDATHRAMDRKRAQKAIEGLGAAGVLLKTPDPERFRISPIIEVLLPVERLRHLWTWLMEQNRIDALPPEARRAARATMDDELDVDTNVDGEDDE